MPGTAAFFWWARRAALQMAAGFAGLAAPWHCSPAPAPRTKLRRGASTARGKTKTSLSLAQLDPGKNGDHLFGSETEVDQKGTQQENCQTPSPLRNIFMESHSIPVSSPTLFLSHAIPE